jgi:hypothetical protein
MKATQWIRRPEENFVKTFCQGAGWLALDTFLLGGKGDFHYGYLLNEVNPRFLKLRLGELGYIQETMSGTEEMNLIHHCDVSFKRSETFRGPVGQRVGIFERQTDIRTTVIFYE